MCQTVLTTPDPYEKPGSRPYEMVWANRVEPGPPALTFEDLAGWTLSVAGGAEAELRPSRAQTVWGRSVGRLRYRGAAGPAAPSSVTIRLPNPVPVPADADCVEMWVFGNRWDWENPPGTPPVRIGLTFRDAAGQPFSLLVDTVRWEEWWLLHRKLGALAGPAVLEGITVSGGWQPEWRTLYLDGVRFYREPLAALTFAPRPRRGLALPAGQPVGANTGPGRLPFPTRPDTILPEQLGGPFKNGVERTGKGYEFTYRGKDGTVTYTFDPARGLSGIAAAVGGAPVGSLLSGGGVQTEGASGQPALKSARLSGGAVTAAYADGTTYRLQVKQKSLIIDARNATGRATGLALGQAAGVRQPRTFWMPFLTITGSAPTVLLSYAGRKPVFTGVWVDWYRTNASELYAMDHVQGDRATINGGARYALRTDGKRNPLFERVFVTVSPVVEEVLPVVPNPVGQNARHAVDRLWQESWGPANYEQEMKRSRLLRAHGIEKLIQCNHEIAWRDGGESFTLRTRAAPGRGGDDALKRYVAHQRSLGWLSGLYTNYTDFAPVNEHWTPDAVQRQPDGEWRGAWPRNYALKPLAAVELDRRLARQVQAKYGSNSAYTDVHTAVAPWHYVDYDARTPGAGTLAQTFYAYGDLLQNDSRVYRGPIFSEGTYHWLYSGLADGNYAVWYGSRPLATEPLLPLFDLREIHPRECDIGMGWTSNFCAALPDWQAPGNIDRSIDRFLLNTLAYGHIGWLVEEAHGWSRTCRSYYMLQQVQARYGLQRPTRIAYWDGARLADVSQALVRDLPASRRQLHVAYPSGLRLWLNDSAALEWTVNLPGHGRVTLPPAGWAAYAPGATPVVSYSGLAGARRVDYIRSPAYVYIDGRGAWFRAPEAGSDGALAVAPIRGGLRVIRVGGTEPFVVGRPFGVLGRVTACRAFSSEGRRLADPRLHDSGDRTWVRPVDGALTYTLTFSGRRDRAIGVGAEEAPPGAVLRLTSPGGAAVQWSAEGARVAGGGLHIPPEAVIGSAVTARAETPDGPREVLVRVVPPLTWSWRAEPAPAGVRLVLTPTWRAAGVEKARPVLRIDAPGGWTARPDRVELAPGQAGPITVLLGSGAAAGASGRLAAAVEGLPGAPPLLLSLSREPEPVTAQDLAGHIGAWGLQFRGRPEQPGDPSTGAVCHADAAISVGGVTRPGIFMHPPYNGGVGLTWAALRPVALPAAPCGFHAWVGLRDGGDPSDGVVFALELLEASGRVRRLAETHGVQGRWTEMSVDLSAFAGSTVRIRLVADVGPADNSSADWAGWGEPAIVLAEPRTVTRVREEDAR